MPPPSARTLGARGGETRWIVLRRAVVGHKRWPVQNFVELRERFAVIPKPGGVVVGSAKPNVVGEAIPLH